jgi:hypothetical protein
MKMEGTGWKGMERIPLAQDRVQCWALINTVLNLWVPYESENFLNR